MRAPAPFPEQTLSATPEGQAYLREQGYKSRVFRSKHAGSRCGLSKQVIHKGDAVAFFRDHGLCLSRSIIRLLKSERAS